MSYNNQVGSPSWSDADRNALIPYSHMEWLLQSFRITRGYSALARKRMEKFPKHYGPKTTLLDDSNNLTEYGQVVLTGAFRAMSQGVYGAGELDVMDEQINEGGGGISPWTALDRLGWDEVKDQLPPWLSTRMGKALRINVALSGYDKRVAIAAQEGGTYRPKGNDARDDIPYINIHHCHENMADAGPETKELNNNPFMFEPPINAANAGADYIMPSYKQLLGAFEFKQLYCPLKEVGEGKNKRLVCDDSTPPVMTQTKAPEKPGEFTWPLVYWARTLPEREIMERAAARYPNGVWLYSTGGKGNNPMIKQFMDFNSLLKLGAFMNGGSATGLSLNIVQLMISISKKADKRENGWDSDIRGKLSGLGGQIRKWIQKSSKKKLGQGPKTKVSSKVATSHSIDHASVEVVIKRPELDSDWMYKLVINAPNPLGMCKLAINVLDVDWMYKLAKTVPTAVVMLLQMPIAVVVMLLQMPIAVVEMPVITVHPDDDILRLLHAEDGDIVSFGRTPMVYRGYALLKVCARTAIGTTGISAEVWAQYNRGDGDGDPNDDENTEELMISSDDIGFKMQLVDGQGWVSYIPKGCKFHPLLAFQLNENTLAKKVYGWYNWDNPDMPNEPYLAFSEKSGKAKLDANHIGSLVARVGITSADSGETKHSLVELRGLVASHYQINVGSGYGTASTMTFLTTLMRWKLTTSKQQWAKDKLKELSDASPRAWEHVYEDMMLTGFNQPGFDFATSMQKCVTGLWREQGEKPLTRVETIQKLQDAYILGAGLADQYKGE